MSGKQQYKIETGEAGTIIINQLKRKQMKITEFSSLYSKEASAVIDASEWVDAIRNGKYPCPGE